MSAKIDPSLADDAGEVCEFRASDGQLLKYRHWRTDGNPRAYVIALHGIQSHSGWYGYSSKSLAAAGIDVRFLDRRGAGLNDHDPGHVANARRLFDDVTEFARDLDELRSNDEATIPIYLLGLSWGARLASTVCARHPGLFDGLILLYPGIYTQIQPSTLQRIALQLTRTLGAGTRRVPVPLDKSQFTTDPQWQQFIMNDPLATREVSVSFLLESESLARTAVKGLKWLALPRLVMLAGQDDIVDRRSTDQLLSRMPPKQLSLIEYPEARHTLDFEPCRDQFVRDLIHWIEFVKPS
ncbi:MAG: alpha/beta fold hydrolase [Planctomycetaceae bacterium]|nr:alpha/beta fold hydrolase [Planctomycetaceae bacterium]